MHRKDWQPTRNERICEKHFVPSDYHFPPFLNPSESIGKKYLKKDAVPTVFSFPDHLKKTTTVRRSPRKRQNPPSASASIPPNIKKSNPKETSTHDHTYATKISPRKLQAKYRKKLKQKNDKLRNLKKKNLRLEKNICGLISKLHACKLLNEELASTLNENFGHMATALFRNECENVEKSAGSRYSEEIKEFTLTLHFYSPRAYKFVRKALHLPHPATIRSWCVNINCEPGFLEKPFNYIENKVTEGQKDCIILLDEMSIKKQVQWDQKNSKFIGRVDYGGIKAEEVNTEATNALVIMACGLQKPWFVPIAYFLTNCLNGEILKQLVFGAIKKLTETGADVHAVVFDGAPKNLGMATKFGCNIKDLDGSFDHPAMPGGKIYVILDVCHMLKLARNAFADMQVFVTPGGENISWEYIRELHRAQQKDILHLGNKLKAKHVQWQNHKMKVSVAAQTLSHSVYAAITFLRNLKLKEFKDSKPTSDFILLMNNLFDVLNSKSKFGKNYKKPITLENILEVEGYLKSGIETLKFLKDANGLPLISGPRKMFVIGFYISALSILNISKNLLQRSETPFEYVLTYRFSQDQLEMYFAKVRSRFGWNNNPTALQFKYAIRQLLLKNKIESPSTANCVNVSTNDTSEMSKVDPRVSNLLLSTTIWRSDVLHYISGYIVKKLLEFIDCPDCAAALHVSSESASILHNGHLSLLSCKKYGKLLIPSSSVCKVVDCVDRKARLALCKWASLSKESNAQILSDVLSATKNNTFLLLSEHSKECHILDQDLRDDHITILIKGIVKQYLVIFYHQFGRVFTERILKNNKASKRRKLTKLILFQNE